MQASQQPGPRVITLGCRLNAAESDTMRAMAAEAGLNDAIIVNTCAVTAEAERQARQAIRRARREAPHAEIMVTGCAAHIAPDAYAAMPEVDRVIPNLRKLAPASFDNADGSKTRPAVGREGRTRALVQVQTGCNHGCTFCIIPFGRGPSRSIPEHDVIAAVHELVDGGAAEIVLTGVDLTSWGEDLPTPRRLGDLVAAVLDAAPDLAQMRLSSLDAIEIDARLFERIAGDERIAPHLHLSLQHGTDLILKRMKRRHARAEAIALCERLRRARPAIAFGADLIAGFPTETEAHFEASLSLVDACGLSFLHVFPFSPRSGTAAARMPQLPAAVIKERAARLRAKAGEALGRHLQSWIGKRAKALVEREGFARLPDFTGVRFDGRARAPWTEVDVHAHDGAVLMGAAR